MGKQVLVYMGGRREKEKANCNIWETQTKSLGIPFGIAVVFLKVGNSF
jgi:hypothetical protein